MEFFEHDEEFMTMLGYACQSGHIEVVEYLLEQGVDVNTPIFRYGDADFLPYAPLSAAARGGHQEIVQELLRHPDIAINVHHFSDIMSQCVNNPNISLDTKANIGAQLCQRGNFQISDLFSVEDQEEHQELIAKICDCMSPKKSARN
eukprot:CAMPEP_0117025408 /NCGR_PEP_ID=MMETSP0472-20121206/18771_1 /TAXON_ID=693140 ORGANISM="Tiarina fusus, Strain LIS" /NCGR_SAMPLE_ID=MMETSP0472 /ASSEMBLY_ACC=CAM_ASM_000603 /LENGTH=146 /DNA_ID=CAMNT_0004732113 /DNA_START=1 /DNA_END=441 /DNA_ORIENTATION=+